jgi:hypothetical protein
MAALALDPDEITRLEVANTGGVERDHLVQVRYLF